MTSIKISVVFKLIQLSLLISLGESSSLVLSPPEIQVVKISGESFREILQPYNSNSDGNSNVSVSGNSFNFNNNYTKNFLLPKELGRVELVCNANSSVRWEYLYKGKSLPILEVRYKRIVRNSNASTSEISLEEIKQIEKNEFHGIVTLRGLIESQTGKYVCRYYNSRLTNNSYQDSATINLFVPGNQTFNEINHVKFINKTDAFVVVPCPVTNPELHVRLFKLNDNIYNKTGELKWKSIYANYNPSEGFRLDEGLGRSLLGDYNCSAQNGKSMRILVADVSSKTAYEAHLSRLKSCWETESFMRLTRSKRLECFCKDSYGLFVNEIENEENNSYEEENRRGRCDSDYLETWLSNLKDNCSDWRVEEFFENVEDSQEVCYRDGIRNMFNGTGTRFILSAMSKLTTSSPANPWLRNMTILYDGLPNWASGFKLGLESGSKVNGTFKIQLLNREPTSTHLYPLAHYRGVWESLIIDIREVKKVHIFQPDSFSLEWFEVSKAIPKDDDDDKNSKPQISNRGDNSTSNSSSKNTFLLSSNTLCNLILVLFTLSIYNF